MENINTASNLAQLIMSLPKTLRSLPVFYEDCDCGKGLHEVSSLYPDRDAKGRIYLRPSSTHHQVTDILSEYNRLNQENEIIRKQVDKARADDIETHTYSNPPEGWDQCKLKKRICKVGTLFDPHNEDHAKIIIDYFRNAVVESFYFKGSELGGIKGGNFEWFDVGYPGKRRYLPFKLDNLDIQMVVDDMEVTPEEFPHDSYMHIKLHFKVQINWKPDLSDTRWRDMDVRHDHLYIYEFDDKLTFVRERSDNEVSHD